MSALRLLENVICKKRHQTVYSLTSTMRTKISLLTIISIVATTAAQQKTALVQKSARSFPKAGKIALVAALLFSGALLARSQIYQFPVPTTSGAWEESQSAYLRGNGYHFYNFQVSYQGTLTLETTGNIDTWGYLWDYSGGYLDYDENSGAGRNFRISHQVSAGYRYPCRLARKILGRAITASKPPLLPPLPTPPVARRQPPEGSGSPKDGKKKLRSCGRLFGEPSPAALRFIPRIK